MTAEKDKFDQTVARPVPHSFFARGPEAVAPELLGCVIASTADGMLTAGEIVETEAYLGSCDPGSHAATRGITARNATMYGPPGSVYVYFTYGNHFMLNLVCEPEGTAGAVLIRALRPVSGLDVMTVRRHGRPLAELANGPGKCAQALGVNMADNGSLLGEGRLQVYYGARHTGAAIACTGRVGLTQGHDLMLRYHFEDDPYVSKGRTGPRRVNNRRSAVADLKGEKR